MMQRRALLNDRNSICQSCPGDKRDVDEMSWYIAARCWRQTLPSRGSVVLAKFSPMFVLLRTCLKDRVDFKFGDWCPRDDEDELRVSV